mmetsp:Transcript_49563/g.149391  ORF Transcript_49563/g.149391 Transcript_49563/m.149391 type:complete len:159 (-) Transcript_49563:243-719(-)
MRRDGNDRLPHRPSQMTLGRHPQFGQYHGRDLLRIQFLLLAPPFDANLGLSPSALDHLERERGGLLGDDRIGVRTSDDPFHVVHRVLGVGRHLGLGGASHHLALAGEGHPGGHGTAGRAGYDLGLVGLFVPACQAGVGGTQIDSNDRFRHGGRVWGGI